jgi:N-hydroxyarylamine O-acetyltransferase
MTTESDNAVVRVTLLPRYLAALGLAPAMPSRTLLGEVVKRHLASLPFASLSVRLGDDMPLALPLLYARLVERLRGGYCFEQNGLLEAMLQALGFQTRLVLARVIYGQDIHPGLTHRIMLVTLEGADHLVDVGFGPLGPRVPVPMAGTEQVDGWRRYRVAEPRSGEFHLQYLKDSGWYSLYRFELHRYGDSDCELGHFYSHRHPGATFVNHLVVARLLPDRVLSLRNRDYRVITAQGEQVSSVESADQLFQLLTADLGLAVTPAEASRLFTASAQ